jgi:hypothetical protein
MPTPTYETIATTSLSGTSSSIDFNSITSAYTDLVIVIIPIGSTQNYLQIQFNGDTNSNYSRQVLSGNGSSNASDQRDNRTAIELDYNEQISTGANYASEINIFDYTNTVTFKNVMAKANSNGNNSGSYGFGWAIGTWRNTGAITSIKLSTNSGTFAAGTRATLYGIKG